MLPIIKKTLKKIFHSSVRRELKRTKRHIINLIHPVSKLTLEEMRRLLTQELGLNRGDKIVVSSGFGNLNADFSPQDLVELLMDVISDEGIIMMPFYPPISSVEWAQKGLTFDMKTNKSSMGIVTNVFARMPNVYMSKHPIKAVCAWGKGAKELVKDHDKSTTPYYWDSPYGKLVKMHSKSLALGVRNMLPMHTIEDVLTEPLGFFYQKEKYTLDVIDKNGEKTSVTTYVHDENILNKCISASDYIASLNCRTYKRINVGYNCICIVENDDLYETIKQHFKNGHTRVK
ncbi:MAG: AAC(3) family N-acetyltransferase [Muribaculaceae bacterium]|nr:AAC(3) family N-acetyltransferase [Muribaculaceae bacterium]